MLKLKWIEYIIQKDFAFFIAVDLCKKSNYCCGASVASVAAVHNLNIKERYKNLRFCCGFLASLSTDHNALRCGKASFSADHNALRCEEPRFQQTRMHCALQDNKQLRSSNIT